MENETGNANPSNGENAEGQHTESVDTLKEELLKIKETNKQLFERAKKSESEAKELREKAKSVASPEDEKQSPTNEPDYARLAYLTSQKVEHPDDQKIVMDEAARLRLPLTDVLQMEHVKNKLNAVRDERNAKLGLPTGTKRMGGVTQRDVEYWIKKGETPIDDQELAEKVVEARLQKSLNDNKFSDIPFIG